MKAAWRKDIERLKRQAVLLGYRTLQDALNDGHRISCDGARVKLVMSMERKEENETQK